MEVIVAIFLLFGAFSLGSATNNHAEDDPSGLELTTTANERQDLSGKGAEAGDVEHTQLRDCLVDRHAVIYRDLSVPYENEIETQTIPASDSEETYPDE